MKEIKLNKGYLKDIDFKLTVPMIQCAECGQSILDTPTNRENNLIHDAKCSKGMPFTPKVGDKFRLLDKEWRVEDVPYVIGCFRAVGDGGAYMLWPLDEADAIDWIKPEPKCSKEFAELVKKEFPSASIIMSSETRAVMGSLHEFVDAHTE